jgi:hypothetical protein
MRNLAQASVVFAALLGAGGAIAVMAVGCGGDDTAVATDAETDVTQDQTATDAKPDHKGDATDKDAEKDAKQKGDAESEASSDDGGDEATPGDAESGADAPPDAPVDSAALFAFPNQVNTTYCDRIAQCCGFDGGGGGAFDIAKCVSDTVSAGGFDNVSVAQVDSGKIVYDTEAGVSCLGGIGSFDCATIADPLWAATLIACSTAMQGTVGINGPCTTYWDCTAGSYCLAGDGGVKHCAPLGTVGAPCADKISSTDCSYRGAGAPANYCSDAGMCEPALAIGDPAGCTYDPQCTSQICDFVTGECQNSSEFTDPGIPFALGGFCASYEPDAGGM